MKFVALCTAVVLMLFAQATLGQDKPYKQGSVWSVTFIKVKPGMFDVYLRDLAANRKALMEQARKAGATITKPAQETFWGGYAGVFQDPDGHMWEVAWNPQWELPD